MKIKDWFKSKPYWLKGGIIGVIFILIIMTLVYTTHRYTVSGSPNILKTFLIYLSLPLAMAGLGSVFVISTITEQITGTPLYESTFATFTPLVSVIFAVSVYIFIFLYYFIVGAAIGWIVGKIKSKKYTK